MVWNVKVIDVLKIVVYFYIYVNIMVWYMEILIIGCIRE